MFLTPVIVFSVWGGRDVPFWSYAASFFTAMAGAALYYVEAAGGTSLIEPVFGIAVKYNKLLLICVTVLVLGFGYLAIGLMQRGWRPHPA